MSDESTTVSLADEVAATKVVLDALASLPRESAGRVLAGVAVVLGTGTSSHSRPAPLEPKARMESSGTAPQHPPADATFGHADLASFFGAAGADDGPAQSMVVAYWKQVVDGQESWSGAEVNSALAHMGRRLPNVTGTMSLLIKRKPACVVQVKKSGSSRQARKLYKLTTVGIHAVRELMSHVA
jgi:hypothetical protein